jgi:hypothetical protein
VDALLAKAFPYAWAALRVQFTPAPAVPVVPVVPVVPIVPVAEEKINVVCTTLDYII